MIGPSLPSTLSKETQNVEGKEKRVIGPSLPDVNDRNGGNGGISASEKVFLERQERMQKANELHSPNRTNPPEVGRAEWMLAPPSASSISEVFKNDPSAALKARGFNQSSSMRVQRTSSNFITNDEKLDTTSWTETPEEREKRLFEEQMGIRDIQGNGPSSNKSKLETEREERIRQAVQQHNEARGPSLLEQHQAKRRKEIREKDRKKDSSSSSDRRHKRERDREISDSESNDSRHRSDKHKSRHHRDRSLSDSERESRSRSHRSSEGHRHHRRDKEDHHKSSRHHHHHHSSSRHRDRSKSPSSKERKERREEKERKREKERKKQKREEEEREEKKGAPTMIWDREAAMSVGGRLMDERKRLDVIKSSSSLSDRFGQGSAKYM